MFQDLCTGGLADTVGLPTGHKDVGYVVVPYNDSFLVMGSSDLGVVLGDETVVEDVIYQWDATGERWLVREDVIPDARILHSAVTVSDDFCYMIAQWPERPTPSMATTVGTTSDLSYGTENGTGGTDGPTTEHQGSTEEPDGNSAFVLIPNLILLLLAFFFAMK